MGLMDKEKTQGTRGRAWKAFRGNKAACVGLACLALILIGCVFAPWLTPHSPYDQDLPNGLSPPSGEHWFGTDSLGRDVFARVLYGGRTTLLMSVSALVITVAAGGALGVAAGYCGGRVDMAVMCVVDVLAAIPAILLAIAVVAKTGIGARNSMLAIALAGIPAFVRLLRAMIMEAVGSPYIGAARALGAGHFRVIFQQILPNILAPVLVHGVTGIADAILAFSSLGYLRIAVQPPQPEWGNMVVAGMSNFFSSWFILVYPCGAVVLTILSLRLVGNGLRDALDPSLR